MKKILIIEDNKDHRENFTELLEMHGYHVAVAGNGEDGLKQAIHHAPDLILCDVQMGGMDGFRVKEKLNEFHNQNGNSKTPFVFVTARSEKQDKERAKELGADAYLVKPVAMETILQTVQTFFLCSEAMGITVLLEMADVFNPGIIGTVAI